MLTLHVMLQWYNYVVHYSSCCRCKRTDECAPGPTNQTGPRTVKAKTQYAASVGLAGVFFWEGGQDAADAEVSLMAAARAAAEEAAREGTTKAQL